jgi:hypothetical protein
MKDMQNSEEILTLNTNKFQNLSNKYIMSTKSTLPYFNSDVNEVSKIKENNSTKNPIDKNLQRLSNNVMKQIFDKEPNDYWSNED